MASVSIGEGQGWRSRHPSLRVNGKEEKNDGFYADKKFNSASRVNSMINFTLILQKGEK